MKEVKLSDYSQQITGRKKALEESFISKMKDHKYNRTAVNQMIGGMSHSMSEDRQRIILLKGAIEDLLAEVDRDYSDDSEKSMLKPQNEREYWLFTEIHQRLKDFQKSIADL